MESSDINYMPEKLTPRVLQVADLLGMYGAELARVLHLQCHDISDMSAAKKLLTPDMDAWRRAIKFIEFYQLLYKLMQGNDVSIYHWLRTNNQSLTGTPLLKIVDDDQLSLVSEYVKRELKSLSKTSTNEPF